MNIGIIIYSQTGNTNSVALKLKEKLSAAGHSVDIEQIEISGELGPRATNFQLKTKPDVDTYDALVFGAPVQAFSLSPAMKSYLTDGITKGQKSRLFHHQAVTFLLDRWKPSSKQDGKNLQIQRRGSLRIRDGNLE